MRSVTLVPAYDRDYQNGVQVKKDWNAGKDFQMADVFFGTVYTSCRDASALAKAGIDRLNIRFNSLSEVVVIRLPSK